MTELERLKFLAEEDDGAETRMFTDQALAELLELHGGDARAAAYDALVRKADGGFIGKIHLDPDNLRYEVKAVSLSYWVGEPYARQGYMTETLKALLDRLFREEGYEIVSAQVLTPNTASAALLEKLGFTREGGLRRALRWRGALYDNLLYSLTREEAARWSGQGTLPTL